MPYFPDVLPVAGGMTLVLDPRRALLALRLVEDDAGRHHPVVPWATLFDDVNRLDLEIEGRAGEGAVDGTVIHHTESRLWVRSRQGDELDGRRVGAIRRRLDEVLDWIGPVYRAPGTQSARSAECPFPHVLVVRPSSGAHGDFDELPGALSTHGLVEVPEKSRFLGGLRYFEIAERKPTAYRLRDRIRRRLPNLIEEIYFEHMPMASPQAFVPNDMHFASQWNLPRISAPEAWDITTGSDAITVAVMDSGCEQPHPDVVYHPRGIDLTTMSGDGSPRTNPLNGRLDPHGTHSTGIIAATIDNEIGIAGIAGRCRVLPLASEYTDMEVAAGIRYAVAEGARVINMSFVSSRVMFYSGPIPAAIQDAEAAGCVICAASGNGDSATMGRPAEHPLVLGCGASDMADERWRAPSIGRGSSWGDSVVGGEHVGVSVVAPGERIWTTDFTGAGGATGFDYTDVYVATSASTPHVSGVAALLLSEYPGLSAAEVRSIIERTAEKVGSIPYTDVAGYPNGTRNPEMGYGRLNAFRAVDLADVMIRDWSDDDGTEPSTPPGGNFYSYSDIVVRPEDDDLFRPWSVPESGQVVRGRTNWIYVRVRNRGPREARNVSVDVRVTPWRGLEFVYPGDWTRRDATHVEPSAVTASFAGVPVGGEEIAKFTLSADQVESLYDWTLLRRHPCLLAQVNAENDYAFGGTTLAGGALIVRRNNIAQRNLSVVMVAAEELRAVSFMAGNEARDDEIIEIVVRADRLSRAGDLRFCSDDSDQDAPRGSGRPAGQSKGAVGCDADGASLLFLDPVRIETRFGGCRGVLTLGPGSRFEPRPADPCIVGLEGGEVDPKDPGRCVRITEPNAVVRIRKAPHRMVPVSIQVRLPADAEEGERFPVDVAQRDLTGRVVGGALTIFTGIRGT